VEKILALKLPDGGHVVVAALLAAGAHLAQRATGELKRFK
jgi:hypothetical protein